MITALFALSLFLPIGSHADAVPTCPSIGCESGLSIDMPEGYHWAKGNYQFHFFMGGSAVRCVGHLPLSPCGTKSIRCNKEGITIIESGCALPPDAQGFGRISISSFPSRVSVLVSRDGNIIGHLSVAPTYKETRIGTPPCEQVCRQGQEKIELK